MPSGRWQGTAGGSKQRLVIVGSGETAELAHDYFTSDSNFEVVAFTVERNFIKDRTLFGLPIIAFEELENYFPPEHHKLFVAISFTQLNRARTRLYMKAKDKGYSFCSYISSDAFIGKDTEIGENCFIFEKAVVQRRAKIGDNVTIWSGSLVGHRSIIKDNCFLASNVAVSGFCEVGENCFLGVSSCVVGGKKIRKDCIIGAGAVIIDDTLEGKIYVGNPAKPLPNKTVEPFISGEALI